MTSYMKEDEMNSEFECAQAQTIKTSVLIRFLKLMFSAISNAIAPFKFNRSYAMRWIAAQLQSLE